MSSRSYPWRIVAAAVISIVGYFYLAYLLLFGLAPGGIDVEDKSGHAVVSYLKNDAPGVRAGLAVGDSLVAVDGQPIGNVVDWLAHRMNFRADQPIHVGVERGGRHLDLTMSLHGSIWNDYSARSRVSQIIFLANKLITLLIGLFVVFSRPRDFASRLGGLVLVTMATVFEAFQWGMASSVRSLPLLVQWPVMLVYVSAAFRTPLLFAFFCLFPKRLIRGRWTWTALLAGPAIATIYALYLFARTVYDPGHLASLAPPWVLIAFGVQSLVYLLAGVLVLPVGYWRLKTITDRRRFRVLFFGTLIGLLFYLPRVLESALVDFSPAIADLVSSPTGNLVCSLGFLVFPLSFAYAILRHRLFNIRVIIRRGLQYALARGVLLSIPPLMAGLLALDLTLLHGHDPLFAVVKGRVWFYGSVAALTGLAYLQRRSWLSWLDRRFFRDKYDAQRLFHEIVEEIRRAVSIQQVAPQVVSRITDALHGEFCALLLRKPGETLYRVISSSPDGALASDLPATNKVIPLVRALDTSVPILLAETGWLGQQLPQVDKDFLHNARIDLLVPVALAEGRTEALLVLGMKLSEEPYSREDVALLENVASTIALLLSRGPANLSGRAFEECPQCGACYDTGTTRCEVEGSTLSLVASPRLLVERYRLEKRLGQGGMGRVYRATDVSLDRSVAVKMIRDEFFSDHEAVERFRRESRAAGGFSHPNIVTVHDFGVDPNQRAFLVMEFLDGITLREELRTQKRLAPSRTVQLFEAICAGVGAAHFRGLVHRDLKPENIFLVRAGTAEIIKITDFGVAKFLPQVSQDTSSTLTGVFVGSLPYMSPEQLRGEPLSPRWDLWALSVIAYETLCGVPPFLGPDFPSLQNAILAGSCRPVSSRIQGSPLWQEFFNRALARSESDRPGSIEEFWAGLQSCCSSAA
jgi:tRNA A-37 threonylcarbamoyl transferase component Bud32